MSAAPDRLYTAEEYLLFERDAATRHEFRDGRIYAMSGASRPHMLISGNVSGELRTAVRREDGTRCEVYGPDMRVLCGDGLRTYPDVSVCCGEPDLFKFKGTDTLRNPDAIVEVSSKSTAEYDRTGKFSSYQTIQTLREYLLVSHTHRWAERFVRTDAGWLHEHYAPLRGDTAFPLLSATVSFEEAYSLTRLPDEPPGPFRVVPATPEMQAADVFPPADESE